MADLIVLLISLPLLFTTTLTIIPFTANAISSCNSLCQTPNDCDGQLICINGKCNDNPDNVGSNVCRSPSPTGGGGGGGGSCESAGNLTCHGKAHSKYNCSPPITSSTRAKLTNNDFTRGGDRGKPSKCDKRYHSNFNRVVALSTGWYNGGSMCGKLIRIRARNGKRTTAKVVDECDSMLGCDKEHAYQTPCKNNIVHGSVAVWKALGLDKDVGVVDVTWSMA